MLEKIKNNKRKLIIISIIIITIIAVGVITTMIIKTIGKNNKVTQIAKAEGEYGYSKPYIPEGFNYVEGAWNTGYVIRETKTGNEFVWIPVNEATQKLQRKNFSITDVQLSKCEETLEEEFSKSVEKYGGYYVARYEAGIPQKAEFIDDDMDVSGKPVSKKGITVWNNISYEKAKLNAEQMYATNSELTSTLMNSYAYDTMLIWLEKSGYNVETDSKNWGNYSNNSQTKNNIEQTGSNNSWKANNIYDLAGNVNEWTTEITKQDNATKYIYRGGSYYNDGNITPAGIRQSDGKEKTANNIGFRTIIYKTGEATIGGYNEPYIPEGFTHEEGTWDSGFVIKENASGNEFVWIPVDGYNLNLERSEFEKTFTTMAKGTDTLDTMFKLSVYKYGGYYIGRYEAGIGLVSGDNIGNPVSKKGATIWTNISRAKAKSSAEQMYKENEELESALISSYAYDTMLNWLKKKDYSKNTYNVDTDSSSWGNYKNTSNGQIKTAGANESWKANNIYDIAGNTWEWTTENYKEEAVVRGGDALSNGDILPAGTRDHAVENSTFEHTGFRVLIYKNIYSDVIEEPEETESKVKVAAGGGHSGYLDESGNLYMWGKNGNGQLGTGNTTAKTTPTKIISNIKKISLGSGTAANTSGDTVLAASSLAIDEGGNLWAWGSNQNGKLGDGSNTTIKTPKKISSEIKFKGIAAGGSFSMGIDILGDLWAWGSNTYGQLGDGSTTATKVPKKTFSGAKFEKISAGIYHSMAIDENGNLFVWGYNNNGRLGDGSTTNSKTPKQILSGMKFKEISAGYDHSMAIDSEGKLWMWGGNGNGQLGNGNTTTSKTPIQILSSIKFKKVSAGSSYSMAIDEDGNLWAWGSNTYGQLGNGTKTTSKTPIAIKSGTKFVEVEGSKVMNLGKHTIALDDQGKVWIWGSGYTTSPTEVIIPKE